MTVSSTRTYSSSRTRVLRGTIIIERARYQIDTALKCTISFNYFTTAPLNPLRYPILIHIHTTIIGIVLVRSNHTFQASMKQYSDFNAPPGDLHPYRRFHGSPSPDPAFLYWPQLVSHPAPPERHRECQPLRGCDQSLPAAELSTAQTSKAARQRDTLYRSGWHQHSTRWISQGLQKLPTSSSVRPWPSITKKYISSPPRTLQPAKT